jgi:hypothetical protein
VAIFETDPIETSSPGVWEHITSSPQSRPGSQVARAATPKSVLPENSSSDLVPPEVPVPVISPSAGVLIDPSLVERLDNTVSETQAPTDSNQHSEFQEAQVRSFPSQDSQITFERRQSAPTSTRSFSQELFDQHQSTERAASTSNSPKYSQPLFPPIELTSSSAPQPPTIGPDSLATVPPQQPQTPPDMPETRRSLRGSGGPAGSPGRGGSSTNSQNSKNLRSIRAEGNAKKKERDEQLKRELAAVKEKEKREQEAKEAEEAAAASSTSTSQESEEQDPAIPADAETVEPVVPRDEDGNVRLADRIPPGTDEEMESTSSSDSDDMEGVSQSADQLASVNIKVSSLRPMEYDVVLPLAANARDQYRQTVKYNQTLIERFTARNWSLDPTVLPQAEVFIETMRDIGTHVDLTNDTTASQGETDPTMVIQWDRSVSTKFKFLHLLLEKLRDQDLHIIVVSRAGKLLDVLQNFLRGTKINFFRTDNKATETTPAMAGSLQVTLLPLTGEGSSDIVRPADLVLTMDQLLDTNDPHLRTLQQHRTQADQLAPVVSLVVANSVDHIERKLISTLTGAHRLRVLVRCITKLRKEAGKVDSSIPSIETSALEVARFIIGEGAAKQWELPPLGVLDSNDAQELSQGIVTMKSAASSDSEKSAKAKAALKTAQKRRLDHIQDEEADSSKKLRMTPQADNDVSTTRISDSMVEQSSLPANGDEQVALRKSYEAGIKAAEARARNAEIRAQEFENDLGDLQLRFEDQTTEKRRLSRELSDVRDALAMAERRHAGNDEAIDILKARSRILEEELVKARELLRDHQIPELAEMERLRREKVLAEDAQKKAEKDALQKESLTGFLRQQYQDATARMGELNQDNDELLAKVKVLEKKASGEIVRVRQLHLDQSQKRLLSDNARLQQENKHLTAQIKKEQETQKLRKSGIGTRAGSVPRSPRVGPVSRGGSPAPAHRVGALKNNSTL